MTKDKRQNKSETEEKGENGRPSAQLTDKQTIIELRSGLERLDQLDAADEPDLSFFLQQVKETKANSRKKLLKELVGLWGLALVILALWTTTYFHSPTVFLILQGIAVVILPFIVYFTTKKEVNKRS
ncbi:YxlC family protein [Shouchella clausii]|uniref:YxlC family protein n=1 Tax=Shouchella clausii TaxID=79880 RepID=UPI00280ABBD4|nr:YxlC family protein [Shouchella clausii]WMM31907.1 YxlC family protein [Shouchella clausii]